MGVAVSPEGVGWALDAGSGCQEGPYQAPGSPIEVNSPVATSSTYTFRSYPGPLMLTTAISVSSGDQAMPRFAGSGSWSSSVTPVPSGDIA